MQVRKLAVTAVVTAASWTAIGLSSPAFALCDSYSGGCPSTPPAGEGLGGVAEQPATDVEERPTDSGTEGGTPGGTPVRGNSGGPGAGLTPTPASLPFTGGELVLMTAVGVSALAGGTALVIAGRRRTATA